ncbi:hypothetical protein [Deinococcus gobiensis]|uniref:Uncharacterized protein n=1 Tax=Deinococcus gobiensis (strain DSM 21396 / JCM 16679 / CGMCC 1.7299 / I-0) TaxID=745776 RepID=H8H0W2_DEIGI|nr:hypothetical protein [Deinococcus gobiensis]AFD26981.1 hypothetical protein DGo_PA0095 [Deinococcus gobiensis I-0]
MRNIKNIALLLTFALSTAATAITSTSTGYGSATASVTASGTYASNVSFTLPAASLEIPSAQVRPGATFKITIPVTNTTDRKVTITAGIVGAPANVTVTAPTPVPANAGATVNLVYIIAFDDDAEKYAGLTGPANFTFPMSAADTAVTPVDLILK